ncbi:MAG: phosphoribosylformylglycinamidine synthase, partial [Erysipelotrichaceae bacterium]
LEPQDGNIVLLIGGRTGRDGIGGATGSSKSHGVTTTSTAGAEVQKGNAIEERKIQRLFRKHEVSEKIIRCNDFGAGGVCVAIGELADGLDINLDVVLKKYDGLDGTEIAISESQERMAIVIDRKDEEYIVRECRLENLEVVNVATITNKNRLVMTYLGQTVVDLDRNFLNENGAKRYQKVVLNSPDFESTPFMVKDELSFVDTTKEVLSRLSVCSQRGLVQRFDSSIGNATVLTPFGGKTFKTETQGMCAMLPVLGKETTTCSLMAYGYSPLISKWSPYHGAIYAVVESLSKIVSMGGNYQSVRFSFQEFFEKLLSDPNRWGKPFSALLGAYRVQDALKLASVGGKDSMSGSFMDLDVPPTLVSFAITAGEVDDVITPELKKVGSYLVEFRMPKDNYQVFDFALLKEQYNRLIKLNGDKRILSAYTITDGGLVESIYKMAFGNNIGVNIDSGLSVGDLVSKNFGNIIVEVEDYKDLLNDHTVLVGVTTSEEKVTYGNEEVMLSDALGIYEGVLEGVYPTKVEEDQVDVVITPCNKRPKLHASKTYDEVYVAMPAFPGTNCELDSKRSFERAGAIVELVYIRNKSEQDIIDSVNELERAIRKSQIVMLPGGFSAGDEPEGSGKFIATVLRNPKIKAAIDDLLDNREGLMIGICNGFQGLIKLGLLPDGKIRDMKKDDATLTFNTIGRHQASMVRTKVVSTNSPWMANVNINDEHIIPISHGEGRFVASKEQLAEFVKNGQIITQYVDYLGNPTMDTLYNPNGSALAIEGLVSKDGRVLGKMAHSERVGDLRNKNVYGEMDQRIFEAGVQYFK